jgi:hypothetical protein
MTRQGSQYAGEYDQNKKVITITGIFSYVVFSHAGFSAYGKPDKTDRQLSKNP